MGRRIFDGACRLHHKMDTVQISVKYIRTTPGRIPLEEHHQQIQLAKEVCDRK